MISESMDRKLPLFQRMGIRLHLMMCEFCSRYRKQLLFIRQTLRSGHAPSDSDCTSSGLSAEARKRIKKYVLDHTNNTD